MFCLGFYGGLKFDNNKSNIPTCVDVDKLKQYQAQELRIFTESANKQITEVELEANKDGVRIVPVDHRLAKMKLEYLRHDFENDRRLLLVQHNLALFIAGVNNAQCR
jgi:hypothetical protein